MLIEPLLSPSLTAGRGSLEGLSGVQREGFLGGADVCVCVCVCVCVHVGWDTECCACRVGYRVDLYTVYRSTRKIDQTLTPVTSGVVRYLYGGHSR